MTLQPDVIGLQAKFTTICSLSKQSLVTVTMFAIMVRKATMA
ncbi:MAG: hypothetical protein GPOALKHO_000490 [Sodalis sp.]|nr:MAG: hypothetical protein GPOALKHO_000490 [Sodalis sp.]